MYRLTLTTEERNAIDWIGYRYDHGDKLYLALAGALCSPDVDWDFAGNVTFIMSEYTAWTIKEIGKNCNYLWDCFSKELASKLTDFCMGIV